MSFASLGTVCGLSLGLLVVASCGQSSDGPGASGASGAGNGAAGAAQAGGSAAVGGASAGNGGSGGDGVPLGGAAGVGEGGKAGSAGSAGSSGNGGGSVGSAGSGGVPGKPTSAVGSGPALSPYLVGQNYWLEQNTEALWPQVKTSHVQLIRYGGSEVDRNPGSNERYAQVVNAIRAIGAEPYLQVSREFPPARAKEVVDYVNNVKGLKVSLWSIGNEPDGTNEPPMSVSAVATMIKTLAPAMKDADPTIKIFSPELTYNNSTYLGPLLGGAQDVTGKDAKGRWYIDGVSFHSYRYGGENYSRKNVTDAGGAMRNTVNALLTSMSAADKKNGRTGANALMWGLTEFNITYANPAQNTVSGVGVHSFLNGQYFAEVFGVGMALNAVTIAPWSIHESSGGRGTSDLGYLDGPLPNPKPRSSYYHLKMFAENFAGYQAPATASQDLLHVVAAGDGNHVSVLLMNESNTNDYAFGVRLDNGALATPAAVTVKVDAALAAEYAGTIPKESTMLLVFDKTGKLTKRVEYSIADATNASAPRVTAP